MPTPEYKGLRMIVTPATQSSFANIFKREVEGWREHEGLSFLVRPWPRVGLWGSMSADINRQLMGDTMRVPFTTRPTSGPNCDRPYTKDQDVEARHKAELDKLRREAYELQERIERAIRVLNGEDADGGW